MTKYHLLIIPLLFLQCARLSGEKKPAEPTAVELYEESLRLREGAQTPENQERIVSLLRQASAQQHPEATFRLGILYDQGTFGLSRDPDRAMELFAKAVRLGSKEAGYQLGALCLTRGLATEHCEQPLARIEQAAADGVVQAMNFAGLCHHEALGTPHDFEKARAWYLKAVDHKDGKAMTNLGRLYLESGRPELRPEARQLLQRSAELGEPEGMFRWAQVHTNPRLGAPDYGVALEWLQKAIEKDSAGAMWLLGWLYEKGLGVSHSYSAALDWYRKAADAGEDEAMNHLGQLLLHGKGCAPDPKTAVTWFRKSADAGNAQGQHNLAVCYETGSGTDRNLVQAFMLYKKAATAGNPSAQVNLGLMYINGTGGTRDVEEGLHWLGRAAAAGEPMAFLNLGLAYEAGLAGKKDRKRAVENFRHAAELGNELAVKKLRTYGIRVPLKK